MRFIVDSLPDPALQFRNRIINALWGEAAHLEIVNETSTTTTKINDATVAADAVAPDADTTLESDPAAAYLGSSVFLMRRLTPRSTVFPYATVFRSDNGQKNEGAAFVFLGSAAALVGARRPATGPAATHEGGHPRARQSAAPKVPQVAVVCQHR